MSEEKNETYRGYIEVESNKEDSNEGSDVKPGPPKRAYVKKGVAKKKVPKKKGRVKGSPRSAKELAFDKRRIESRAKSLEETELEKAKPETQKKGRLSNKSSGKVSAADKLRVLEMSADGISPAQIADQMDRTPMTIARIIETFKRLNLKAFNQDVSQIAENENIRPDDYMDTKLYNKVVGRLFKAGIHEDVARARIQKICLNAKEKNITKITEEELYNAALKIVNGAELFINKSAGGRSGVSMATTASSERGDTSPKANTKISDKHRDRIFRTK